MVENKPRRYGVWGGNPKGVPEDSKKCIVQVHDSQTRMTHQCKRKRGYGADGNYCKQHAKRFRVIHEKI